MKGSVSAQKALQGFEAETRELLVEMEENSFYRQIDDITPPHKNVLYCLGAPYIKAFFRRMAAAEAHPPTPSTEEQA